MEIWRVVTKHVSQLMLRQTKTLLENIHSSKIEVKFERNCLKQDKVSFTYEHVVNILLKH